MCLTLSAALIPQGNSKWAILKSKTAKDLPPLRSLVGSIPKEGKARGGPFSSILITTQLCVAKGTIST